MQAFAARNTRYIAVFWISVLSDRMVYQASPCSSYSSCEMHQVLYASSPR